MQNNKQLSFFSRKLNSAQRIYSIGEQVLQASIET
jgi:hypothetical protein